MEFLIFLLIFGVCFVVGTVASGSQIVGVCFAIVVLGICLATTNSNSE